MKIIKDKILIADLKKMAQQMFGNLVKAVVDVKKEIIVVAGELHSDEEALLLEKGSKQKNLWGINLYPFKPKEEWIEFDSIINLRPSLRNYSRDIEDQEVKEKIKKIIYALIKK